MVSCLFKQTQSKISRLCSIYVTEWSENVNSTSSVPSLFSVCVRISFSTSIWNSPVTLYSHWLLDMFGFYDTFGPKPLAQWFLKYHLTPNVRLMVNTAHPFFCHLPFLAGILVFSTLDLGLTSMRATAFYSYEGLVAAARTAQP